MEVVIIKHFVNKELNWECGYYLVNGTIVIQNGEHWSAVPYVYNKPIMECLCDITQKTKGAIKEALVKAGEIEALDMAIKVLDRQNADGCTGCAFGSVEEWEMPCCKCKRGCKDYWRAMIYD